MKMKDTQSSEPFGQTMAAEAAVNENGSTVSLFVIRSGTIRLGLSPVFVEKVKELEGMTALPTAPSHVLGLVGDRSRALPVIDMRVFLGIDAKTTMRPGDSDGTETRRILLVSSQELSAALLVDEVEGACLVNAASVAPAQSLLGQRTRDFATGEVLVGGRLVAVLDLHALLEAMRVARGA